MAARYIPGSGGVGGDWYDVFTLPSGELCVVIGDVAGSGLPAAVIMGRMRSALRAYALETRIRLRSWTGWTARCSTSSPTRWPPCCTRSSTRALDRMHVCLAGHFPPVIAYPGQPAELAGVAAGLMIGFAAPGAQRPVTTVPIPPGTLLCFYTDGLIERPGEVIDDGLARLCQAVTAQPPEAACAAVMMRWSAAGQPATTSPC